MALCLILSGRSPAFGRSICQGISPTKGSTVSMLPVVYDNPFPVIRGNFAQIFLIFKGDYYYAEYSFC